MFPGHPRFSHDRTFFGNASTNANSTLASLRTATTTCKPKADKAAYWTPTLYHDGREVRPSKAQFYYDLSTVAIAWRQRTHCHYTAERVAGPAP